MPPEVLPDAFLCDSNCSKGKEDDINVLSWYTHVLPQLRDRYAPQRHYHCEVLLLMLCLLLLSRSLSDCHSLTINVIIQVSQFVRNKSLNH